MTGPRRLLTLGWESSSAHRCTSSWRLFSLGIDNRQHKHNQSPAHLKCCKLLAFMSVCRPRGEIKKSFGCLYRPSASSVCESQKYCLRSDAGSVSLSVHMWTCTQCTLCIWGVVWSRNNWVRLLCSLDFIFSLLSGCKMWREKTAAGDAQLHSFWLDNPMWPVTAAALCPTDWLAGWLGITKRVLRYLGSAGRRTPPGTRGSCQRGWRRRCRLSPSACWFRSPRHPLRNGVSVQTGGSDAAKYLLWDHVTAVWKRGKNGSPDLSEALPSCRTVRRQNKIHSVKSFCEWVSV